MSLPSIPPRWRWSRNNVAKRGNQCRTPLPCVVARPLMPARGPVFASSQARRRRRRCRPITPCLVLADSATLPQAHTHTDTRMHTHVVFVSTNSLHRLFPPGKPQTLAGDIHAQRVPRGNYSTIWDNMGQAGTPGKGGVANGHLESPVIAKIPTHSSHALLPIRLPLLVIGPMRFPMLLRRPALPIAIHAIPCRARPAIQQHPRTSWGPAGRH